MPVNLPLDVCLPEESELRVALGDEDSTEQLLVVHTHVLSRCGPMEQV
jgi:hypothetical protein